jgi:hypothetical protein
MKKLTIILFIYFHLLSFSQEKIYNEIFDNCKGSYSPSSCVMEIITKEVQSEYEEYRIEVSKKYDLYQVIIKYTITKKGILVIESIGGDIYDFKPKIIELFKKFPKVQPVIENGKIRNALMTTSFYLFPNKK